MATCHVYYDNASIDIKDSAIREYIAILELFSMPLPQETWIQDEQKNLIDAKVTYFELLVVDGAKNTKLGSLKFKGTCSKAMKWKESWQEDQQNTIHP